MPFAHTVFERSKRIFREAVEFQGGVDFNLLDGAALHVATDGNNANDGLSFDTPKLTIAGAQSAAVAGDQIFIAPGDYDEAVVVTKDDLTFVGAGPRGSVAIAPSAADSKAWLIDGTTGSGRVEEVHLLNLGGEGNGTGGGIHVKGDIRRVTADYCKFEGGAFAAKLESTAQGSVGDVKLRACELGWTEKALHVAASGGGDPVTQTELYGCLLHNFSEHGVLVDTVHSADLWLLNNIFARLEDGTEPASEYVKADVAATTGFVARNVFPAAKATGKIALAAGVIRAGNFFTDGHD